MTNTPIEFTLHRPSGSEKRTVNIARAIIAGWTGRDQDAMEAHIRELEDLGVTRPERTPIFYRVAASRITTAARLEAIGSASSGEVEFFLINMDGDIWVGVGSDHTDREAETQGVTLSKQLCDKPIGQDLWLFSDVVKHWEQLQLCAVAVIDDERTTYQKGTVSAMLTPNELMQRFADENNGRGLEPGDLMMCGTLPAIGGVRASSRFECELVDPVLERRIASAYDIEELPIEG
jgi:hypothetical protein